MAINRCQWRVSIGHGTYLKYSPSHCIFSNRHSLGLTWLVCLATLNRSFLQVPILLNSCKLSVSTTSFGKKFYKSTTHCAKPHLLSFVSDPVPARSLPHTARVSEQSVLTVSSTQGVILKTSIILPSKPFLFQTDKSYPGLSSGVYSIILVYLLWAFSSWLVSQSTFFYGTGGRTAHSINAEGKQCIHACKTMLLFCSSFLPKSCLTFILPFFDH